VRFDPLWVTHKVCFGTPRAENVGGPTRFPFGTAVLDTPLIGNNNRLHRSADLTSG
jgi:hypothetical protein